MADRTGSTILSKFPKIRMDLPEAYQQIYNQHYLSNREGQYKTTSLSARLERWMHKKVARDLSGTKRNLATLEIGAGTLNHLQYEPDQGAYDIVEPFSELFENSPRLKGIRTVYKDISDIRDTAYDRITTIATFEHIMDLPFVVGKAALLLKPEGHMRVAIPNEGTFMWRLGTRVTGFEFTKKYGLDYQVLMRYEHVNTAEEIEGVLKYFFKNVKCSVYGISKKIAFYRFYECSSVIHSRIDAYFRDRTTSV